MATEKILIFDEAGNAKRMKVRIARFLDNEPVTASDKENIRTTLNVDGSQSGTFTTPLSVTSASDSSFSGGGNVTVSGGVTTLNNSGDNALRVESTNGNPMYVNVVGAAQNYLFDVRDDGTSKFRVDGSGRVGIGGSPSDTLSVSSSNTGRTGVSVGNTTTGGRTYIIGSVGSATDGGAAAGSFTIRDGNASANRVTIDSSGNMTVNSGNLVIGTSGKGIDFGSGASTTLADYEEGTWTPVFGVTSGSFATMTMDVLSARYVKVGNLVNFICYIRTSNVNTTGTGGQLIVSGLPYANAGSNNFAACSVGYAQDWATAPAAGYVVSGGSYIFLTKRVTGINGDLSEMVAGDMTTGAVPNENQLMISGSYSSF